MKLIRNDIGRVSFFLLAAALGGIIFLAGGEALVRVINPIRTTIPKPSFSEDYGIIWPPDITAVFERPGYYHFTARVNRFGLRGKAVAPDEMRGRTGVVVLGDSFTFGAGVDDGEEYSAVLSKQLGDGYRVVNLGMIGFGLTQQIKRYYEMGAGYNPSFVVLQFCQNDPTDNLEAPVTTLENGAFAFHKLPPPPRLWLKNLAAANIFQKSQFASFLKEILIYRPFYAGAEVVDGKIVRIFKDRARVEKAETVYVDLLRAFATKLRDSGVKLVMISVDGDLELFPSIQKEVESMASDGLIDYREVRQWLAGMKDYASPEGHLWGTKAHAVIGENLARVIATGAASTPSPAGSR